MGTRTETPGEDPTWEEVAVYYNKQVDDYSRLLWKAVTDQPTINHFAMREALKRLVVICEECLYRQQIRRELYVGRALKLKDSETLCSRETEPMTQPEDE